MKSNKKRILFFTPFGTRTGSEMMLLYILQNIDRTRFDVGIVSFARGELLSEFPADIPVFIVPRTFSLFQKIQFHLGHNPTLNALRRVAQDFNADFWYVNTIMLPETVTIAKEFSIKLITHFHELPLTYIYLKGADMKGIITYSHTLIGCSEVTCEAIRQAGGKNVELLYEFVDPAKLVGNHERTGQLRRDLGIAESDYVWVGSGMTSERKGFDMLPDLAEELDDPRVHLVWVGSRIDDGLVYYTEQRCRNSKSKTRIHLVGKQKEDYCHYLNVGDGFLLTSRQDPFPLVMIEAAWLGKPIVSFPSGGVSEFVEEGMGVVTEDISVRQMVVAMRKVMDGSIATDPVSSKERASQFNVQNGYRNWTKIMDRIG